jgi:hypothetical protein
MDWLIQPEAGTRVLEAHLAMRPVVSSGVLLGLLAAAWLVVILMHRSRRLEIGTLWRVVLGTLRMAVVAVPVIMLAQPHVLARLERSIPRTLVLLLDESRSMSVTDGTEAKPISRWDRAAKIVEEFVDQSGSAKVLTYAFGEQARLVDAINASVEPAFQQHTAIGDALRRASADASDQSVVGIVVFSDGSDNASSPQHGPLQVARSLAKRGIPVHAVLVGNEQPRDVSVSVVAEAPFAFASDPVPLRVHVEHRGFADEAVTITLFDGEKELQTRDVVLAGEDRPTVERFEIQPLQPGRIRYHVQISPLPGELTTSNNAASCAVHVIEEPIRLLYVEHWPRWQYQFLRNAVRRDHRFDPHLVLLTEDPATPVEERQTASFPTTIEDLEAFDVVVLGDLSPQDLSPQQWNWIHDHVLQNGAGLVLVAGPRHMPASFADTPIGPLLPFDRVVSAAEDDIDSFQPAVTTVGSHHPLMRLGFGDDVASVWRRLPELQWCVQVDELKPGAVTLAQRPGDTGDDSEPLIVLQRAGRGSVLYVGTDETWRWRYELGNRYFYGFWAHAIQHVGMRHRIGQFNEVRVETPLERVAPQVPVKVSVAFDEAGDVDADTDARQARVLLAESADGGLRSFTLRRAADSPFVYETTIELPAAGAWRLFVEGFEGRGESRIDVSSTEDTDPELALPVVNTRLLRELTELTGGMYTTAETTQSLIDSIDLSPLRYRWSKRIALWDGWTALLILASLLTAEWVLRKWIYLP